MPLPLTDAIDSMENWVSAKYGDGDEKVEVVTKQIKALRFIFIRLVIVLCWNQRALPSTMLPIELHQACITG